MRKKNSTFRSQQSCDVHPVAPSSDDSKQIKILMVKSPTRCRYCYPSIMTTQAVRHWLLRPALFPGRGAPAISSGSVGGTRWVPPPSATYWPAVWVWPDH
ncbi:hypothetical protein CDAR_218861 [Caerostris darwini]|uniref:Uncharacterized protein n=1 Tax=Caerostris darwini TaxID=1538125 RepID=A0AAV4VPC1_9ARAC|nr:hypothetical protein CDAR_218861 [Caerostris darwini]